MIKLKNGKVAVSVKKVISLGGYEFDHIEMSVETEALNSDEVDKIYSELEEKLTSIKNYIKSGE